MMSGADSLEQRLYEDISKMLTGLYKSPKSMKCSLLKLADSW